MKYVVVIPAKNEQGSIRDAIESIVRQTIPPQCVLVMDDGSTDDTPNIIKSMQTQYPMLRHHAVPSDNSYSLGGHVVRLFNRGKRILDEQHPDYDWIIKLDADLCFDANVIESIAARIQGQRVGIVSGTPYYLENGRKIYERSPAWHTHGQFKIYNRQCYEEMGGIPESLGWDTADNIKAISSGWLTCAYPDINYLMYRKVGGKSSLKKGRINHGIGCYLLGYDPLYFMIKTLHDLFKPPAVFGAYYLIKGYLKANIERPQRILSSTQRKTLKHLLWSSLATRIRKMEFVMLQKLLRKQ